MEKRQNSKNIFKLIAIQPVDCAPCILKNLKRGDIYYFYKGYSIKDDQITIDESLMNDDFFKDENSKLNISIHTIVGKNGSGKSAIVELLMRVLNNIAYILQDQEKDPLNKIYPVSNLEAFLFYQVNDSIYRIHLNKLKNEERDGNMYYPAVNPELSATILKMNSSEEEHDIKSIESSIIKDFFYTIVINYAIYAYNGNDFGGQEFFVTSTTPEKKAPMIGFGNGDGFWLNNIMHKNDGYTAPLVVHPQRTNGDIDINNEKYLTISRLLSLFVKMHKQNKILRNLNDKNEISNIIVTVNENDLNPYYKSINLKTLKNYFINIPNSIQFSIDLEQQKLFKKFKQICTIILRKWNQVAKLQIDEKIINFDLINDNIYYNYLVYKTMVIINKYLQLIIPDTKYCYNFSGSYKMTNLKDNKLENEIEKHILAIQKDNSHITLKLKQTLNYIKYTRKEYSKNIDKNDDIELRDRYKIASDEIFYSKFTPEEFSSSLNLFNKEWKEKVSDILYFMPPPFLNIKIFYKDIDSSNQEKREYPFDYLSSGEKQYTFFITTILYHLRNIDSAHRSRTNRRKFENVNLIFEEIELYFHPEMQRKLIHDILISLKNMHFHHIKNINICLVTHSPIILSDIPTSNGLFLKDGKHENMIEQTFASNIYSLFRNAFFIEGAPIGEFAVNKINQLCKKNENKNLSDSELFKEINQIGDPIIKSQVMKLFENRYNTVMKIHKLEEEIKQLKLKLND